MNADTDDGRVIIADIPDGWRITYKVGDRSASTTVLHTDVVFSGQIAIDEAVGFVKRMAIHGYA